MVFAGRMGLRARKARLERLEAAEAMVEIRGCNINSYASRIALELYIVV
jgi:hypothetical protein